MILLFAPALLLLGIGIMLVGGIALLSKAHKAEMARVQYMMNELSADLGLRYTDKDAFGLLAQLQEFDLFKSRGRITHVMSGNIEDTMVHLFEYAYTINTGKSSVTIRQTVFFANDKEWSLPNFRLKPETWWHKVLTAIGLQRDINFSENPDFSTRFWLTGNIEGMIREKFSPDLQQFFCERPPVHLSGNNYYLVAYKPGKVLNPDEARVFFEHCCQMVKLLKKQGKDELLSFAELRKTTEAIELEKDKLLG